MHRDAAEYREQLGPRSARLLKRSRSASATLSEGANSESNARAAGTGTGFIGLADKAHSRVAARADRRYVDGQLAALLAKRYL